MPQSNAFKFANNILTNGGYDAADLVGAAGGSFTFLGETTASNVATVDLNGYFTSDYDVYKVFLDGVYGATNDSGIYIRVATTGSYTVQTSDYATSNFYMLATGPNTGSTSYDAQLSTSQMYLTYSTSSTSTNPANLELTIYNPMGSNWKSFTSLVQSATGDLTRFIIQMNAGVWRNTTAITGIRFFMSSGNIYARKLRIYGVKNS